MKTSTESLPKSTETTTKRRGRPRKQSKGLGDDIEKITKATGIKKVVDTFAELTGIDCGCDARKEKLNKLFPKRIQPLCLEEKEYNVLKEFFTQYNGLTIEAQWQKPLSEIHARVFQHKMYVPCSCSPKEWIRHINELKGVYSAYDEGSPII